MVWVSADASDDAASSVDCVKAKPLKRRCAGGGLGRVGGLSRYYSSKSQSFSSLELVTQCTPYGTSSLALAKRRSSFDLQRQAAAATAATAAAAAVPGTSAIAKGCSVRLSGGSSTRHRSIGGSPAAPSSARAVAAARFASAFAAACSLAASSGQQHQDGAAPQVPAAGRNLLGAGCSSSDDDVDLLLSGDGEADDEAAPARGCSGGDALCHADDRAAQEGDDEEGEGDRFLEEDDGDDDNDDLLCGPGSGSRRCPCNDTIFGDPADAVLSPAASPPLQHASLQAYAAGADLSGGSSCAAVLAAALAAGGGCAQHGAAAGLAAAHHQLALQQQLTAEYCNRLAAVLLPSGHSGAASVAACGSGCSSGGYMGSFGVLPPMAPSLLPASRPGAAARSPLHASRSTEWDSGVVPATSASAGGTAIGACAAAAGGPRIWTSLSAGGMGSGPSCLDMGAMQPQDGVNAASLAPVLSALPPRAPAQYPSCALAGLALSQPGSGDWAASNPQSQSLLQAAASASSPCQSAATTATAAGGAATARTTAQSGDCGLGPQHVRHSHHRASRHHGSPAQLSSLWGSTENLIASLSLSEQQQQRLCHHGAKRRGHGRSLSHRTATASEAPADPMAVDAQACNQQQEPQQQDSQVLLEPLPASLASAYWSAGAAAGGCSSASACIQLSHAQALLALAPAAVLALPQAPHAASGHWAPYGSAPARGSAGFLSSAIM
ncbi:hypothetical protein CHLRE_09g396550v5 [Chlamydomonas reinhardtii]|uniref:Uncharacterized protein n=1 Tax=Chlamydomonas reinhardtii TaxID=3055 RepID=A0A2K3DD49_CHLRE|nr:uncharacterized protein CHLRE_09g396550v5 [Chlamydomonas reinhardtii]PNW78462.1 hypothetical protein CHLRE_09g396550v5 [Chlamydomonas reinhardtii]